MRRFALLAVIFVLLAAGCLRPVQNLGCCLRANISSGCVLYNTTDFSNRSLVSSTHGTCDNAAQNLSGHCNVSIDGSDQLIPICSEDQIVPCIAGNCTAMVCGDYAFKPKVAPGFGGAGTVADPEKTSSSVAGNIPPGGEEKGTQNFYKAQCRFLPMDAQLKNIMKNSKSSINVFRLGVGGSFDEFDQYRYFFPISDKFCNINPPQNTGDQRVDRYMNYLTSSGTSYDPITGITNNCLDGTSNPPPMSFAEDSSSKTTTDLPGIGSFTFSPVVPDSANYKFAHWGRVDAWATYDSGNNGFYEYSPYFANQNGVFKKIDDAYYRRALAIAHADTIFDTGNTGHTRASFECDSAANDCYSGSCDTRVYNRGVFEQYVATGTPGKEIVVDCNKVADENKMLKVICGPTKSVTPNGTDPPTFSYASVSLVPTHFEILGSDNPPIDYNTIAQNDNALDPYWDAFNSTDGNIKTGSVRTITNTASTVEFYYTQKKYCSVDYGASNSSSTVLCSYVAESGNKPPAGGVVFFGKLKDERTVKYKGDVIIGWADVDSSQFNDLMVKKNCDLQEGTDYVKVKLDSPTSTNWTDLMGSFKPYFEDRVQALKAQGFNDGCGGNINPEDVVVSSMPWVIDYAKGGKDSSFFGTSSLVPLTYQMSSTSAQSIRSRNMYNEVMDQTPGTSSCEMRRTTFWWIFSNPTLYFDVGYSQYIYLIKYSPNSGKIGKCAVDEKTYLPQVKTFGWCQSCTTSTLAYQNVTAYNRVYMPAYTANIQLNSGVVDPEVQSICSSQYNVNWAGFSGFQVTDNVSCFNQFITDISDYKESIGSIGSPKTIPEASIMKERLGNYMKSGVLPVLDLSDASNWNITNPDSGTEGFCLFYFFGDCGQADNYQQYDFQRLVGSMGAAVVIVDHVNGDVSNDKESEIVNRSGIVRGRCFGCLTAVHIDSPTSSDSLRTTAISVVSDPRANFNLDMITFDYAVSSHSSAWSGISDYLNRSDAIADDITSYGRAVLNGTGKPTMVVGFNVDNNDGNWGTGNFKTLFDEIVIKQDEMVKAGVTGIVYSPARDSSLGTGKGIVMLDGSGVGSKTPKFCALQDAMLKMTTNAPVALFTASQVVDAVNCTACSGLDFANKVCGPDAPTDPKLCDDGVSCTVPADMNASSAKCPIGTSVSDCPVCNESSSSYTCTYKYANGSSITDGPHPMAYINGDTYADVIGGLPRPNKCCLVTPTGQKYTYVKQSYQSPLSKPIAFPRTGDPNVDCGLGGGDTKSFAQISTFCNIKVPIKDYDINCSVS